MKKKLLALLLAAVLMGCCGCDEIETKREDVPETAVQTTEPTVPAPTVPGDGNPGDVTCKGSYTSEAADEAVIAKAGTQTLTNKQLQSWYWAAVAQYAQAGHGQNPDYSQPLDMQTCETDTTVASWQQYFLKLALENWHKSAAMEQQAAQVELTTEEAYQPNMETHGRCMTGMPATKFLYGYDKTYETNTMHQAYLDSIPQLLRQLAEEKGYAGAEAMAQEAFGSTADDLAEAARQYNYAYMYQTFLNYNLEITEEMLEDWYLRNPSEDTGELRVDIRHIQLMPEEGDWEACEKKAQELLNKWENRRNHSEATFGELAYWNSQDAGSASSGGRYANISQEQLPQELAQWCFAEERQTGDTAVIRTEEAVHVVYLAGAKTTRQLQAEQALTREIYQSQLQQAKEAFPMEVTYGDICLVNAHAAVSFDDLLYPDVAHERYPEVPLYLQQDYPYTWYGNYKISSHGCGITTFAMLATYMADDEWTPPEMCELYGNYSFVNGTDGMIFINESPNYNFYFRERTFDPNVAKQAVENGHIVVSIQHKGYWTNGGHYILYEKFAEDGMVQVRDSNIANYAKLPQHKEDKHTWFNATYAGNGYWIFEKKITRMESCTRCGNPQDLTVQLLNTDYLCEKCQEALSRRDSWLSGTVS